jgi:hypothetical protein
MPLTVATRLSPWLSPAVENRNIPYQTPRQIITKSKSQTLIVTTSKRPEHKRPGRESPGLSLLQRTVEGRYRMIFSVTVVVWVMPPPVAVTVIV